MLLLLISSQVATPASTHADSLRDIMRSSEMQRIQLNTNKMKTRRNSRGGEGMSWYNGMDPKSNFALLWGEKNGVRNLLSWVGADIVNWKLTNSLFKRQTEFVRAETSFVDRSRHLISMKILVPHPTYRMMVELHTLAAFNALEPPTLKVVASEDFEVNGHKGIYYRAEDGSCSILFKVAQLSVVNLYTKKCENSSLMMDIARNLDFNRLNEKLSS